MARGTLPGTLVALWLDADPSASPTQAELTANGTTILDLIGTANSEGLAEMAGWIVNSSTIPTPDYLSHTVGTVPGDSVVQDSSMSFYYDSADTELYTQLTEGTSGFVVLCFDGLGTGEEAQVWPVTVQTRFRRPNRDQAHIYDVNFAVGTPEVRTQTT